MSTWLYLECLDHDPPLLSAGEVGQHLTDLPTIRADVANRAAFVVATSWDDEGDEWSERHHFQRNSIDFLRQHPTCRIGIRDQYGHEHNAAAWEAGHKHPWRRGPNGCTCYARSRSECVCGRYGTGELLSLADNPYSEPGQRFPGPEQGARVHGEGAPVEGAGASAFHDGDDDA